MPFITIEVEKSQWSETFNLEVGGNQDHDWSWTLAYVADHGGPVVDEQPPVPPAHRRGRGRGHRAHQAHVLTLQQVSYLYLSKFKLLKS